MRIVIILSIVIILTQGKDSKKRGKLRVSDVLDFTPDGVTTVYFAAEAAQNPLCRALNCKSDEVCLISKDDAATCMREKVFRKALQTKSPAKLQKKQRKTPANNDCPPCPVVHPTFVCGSDNVTYSSECRLQYKNCIDNSTVQVSCQGRCPCKQDVWESFTLDGPETTTPMQLKKFQMRDHGLIDADVDNDPDNLLHIKRNSKGERECSKKEMKEMRHRLVNWFYIVFRRKVEEGDPADFVQTPVCENGTDHAILSWMFRYFDKNENQNLDLSELFELEADKYEHCINPLLEHCDKNHDLDLSGPEWCRCFQEKHQKFSTKRKGRINNYANNI